MDSRRLGYAFTLLAIAIFCLQDALSKHLGGIYPPIFIAMIRFWAFACFVTVLGARGPGGLRAAVSTRRPVLQVFRGALLAFQVALIITAFAEVGLARSQAILASAPLFVAMLSMPFLGERVGWQRWSAIVVGLCGVLLILSPEGGAFDAGLLMPLVGALLFAIYVIATRLANRSDPAGTSFFYTGVAGAVAISLIGPFYWTGFAPADWPLMGLLCVTGIASHYFLIRAYDLLDASAVQPLTYLQVVLAAAVGVVVFGETLNLNMIAGSAIVVVAGIFTLWRENVVARRMGKGK